MDNQTNNKSITNEDLGWNEFFESSRQNLGLEDFPVARVVSESKGAYKVKNSEGEFLAKVTGRQMFLAKSREDYPAVGDWVAIENLGNEQAVVKGILPRKTVIKRKFGDKNRSGGKQDVQVIAANIDTAFLVQSVGRDFSANRFERYLTLLENSQIEAVMVINKADLISKEELEEKLAEIKGRLEKARVVTTSTVNEEGLDELKSYIEKGKTYCFLGSSGVGKSSLINKLIGKNDIKTGDISSYSDRGKHVTTSRETYFLENGGILIDNPGVREVGLAESTEGMEKVFDEIEMMAQDCKYADCTHTREPGCAVTLALREGRLDGERYANYVNLKKEAEYLEMNETAKREKDRRFGKFMKKAKKELKQFNYRNY